MAYDKTFTDALQSVWGRGFLSPGGPEAVASFLAGTDLRGKAVLDIGSGLGGVDLLLVQTHGAAQVTGIDVDPWLVAQAQALIAAEGVADRIGFVTVKPGPLALADASFDMVVSKDAMIHMPDKAALYADVWRVLRPGGRLVASDWFFGPGAETSAEFQAWMPGNTLHFAMTTPEEALAALRAAGFADAYVTDQSAAAAQAFEAEIDRLHGPLMQDLRSLLGDHGAADRLSGAQARLAVVRAGHLRPSHVGGTRPG